MPPSAFRAFQKNMVDAFGEALKISGWRVVSQDAACNMLDGQFSDRQIDVIQCHGIDIHLHLLELDEPSISVPVAICLPCHVERPVAGVCCFSGHSSHGLRDLVLDLDSYQAGIATRLAQAGIASIAVEKIDSGLLSRGRGDGIDEMAVASHYLAWGRTTRAVQLQACLAACELLAGQAMVDHTRIGATGVSLGGWLSVQCALMTDRIKAVADFGRKTVLLPDSICEQDYGGCADWCQIMPGMLRLGGRNTLSLAYAPRPMLAGHGLKDAESCEQSGRHFRSLFQEQYDMLGFADHYHYHAHADGDVMPSKIVIDYFARELGLE
jgi:hypothetical protein